MVGTLRALAASDHAAGGGLRWGGGASFTLASGQAGQASTATLCGHLNQVPSPPLVECCSERVAAMSTLALFLSYLGFSRAGYTGE